MGKQIVITDKAPSAVAAYSQAIVANGFVFCSGQIALDPETGKMVDGGVEEQTTQALNNLKAVLEAAGSGLDKVVKASVFLKNIEDFAAMNGVYSGYFTSEPPARAAFGVGNLPLGALVEVECIALVE